MHSTLRVLIDEPPDLLALARTAEDTQREKHHRFLNLDLLTRDYASSILDLEGAQKAVASI